MSECELLNLPRMSRRLGVAQQWLKEEADAGRVPCLKAGKRYLFDAVAVQGAIASRAARSQPGEKGVNRA